MPRQVLVDLIFLGHRGAVSRKPRRGWDGIRLDKYLKVSRLIKRRTLAKEICDAGQVEVNGRPAKAGHEVRPGDTITLRLGNRRTVVEVLATPASARAEQASETYRLIEGGPE